MKKTLKKKRKNERGSKRGAFRRKIRNYMEINNKSKNNINKKEKHFYKIVKLKIKELFLN